MSKLKLKEGIPNTWQVADGGRTLIIASIDDEKLEGVYSCWAENKLGGVGLHARVELKGDVDETLALALGIGLGTVVLVILACAIVGVKYYHKKWRQTKAKLSPKVRFTQVARLPECYLPWMLSIKCSTNLD